MHVSKELVAASSPPIILSILARGDSYGYEIIKTVEQESRGMWNWSEGMLYPILHRMERSEWISSYWSKGSGARRRKYYRLEPAGLKALAEQREQWNQVHEILDGLLPDETPKEGSE
jgi:PadR family transcriptional regulator PadR